MSSDIDPERSRSAVLDRPPRNAGTGRFTNVSATGGDYFQGLHQGRGLAAGDLDNDGDVDLVIVHYHAPSVILWNDAIAGIPHSLEFLVPSPE